MIIAQLIATVFGKIAASTPQITTTILTVLDAYKLNSVLFLTAESGGTGSFIDDSSNKLTVTANGTPGQGVVSPYYAPGYYSTYLSSSSYLRVPYTSNFDLSTGDWTMEAWFNLDSFTSGNIVSKDTYGANYDWNIGLVSETLIRIYTAGTAARLDATVPTMSVKVWYHVAITRSGTTTRIFLNGISYASSNLGLSNSSQSYVTIGCSSWNNPGGFINGYISNVRIVKGTAVYTTNFIPSTTPLTAIPNTVLLTCQSNRFIDNTVSPPTITTFVSPKISSFQPFAEIKSITDPTVSGLKSVYFNGSTDYLTVPANASFSFGTGDFTVEFWMYATSFYNYITIFSTPRSTTSFSVGTQAAAQLVLYIQGSGEVLRGTTAMAANTWNHCAFTRSGTTMRAFLNGRLEATATNSTNLTQTTASIGSLDNTSEYFTGYISNLRVVKGTALYTGAFIPPIAPLTAITNTSLLTFTGANPMVDSSTNALTITPIGAPQVKTFSPFDATPGANIVANTYNSTYFDGSSHLRAPNNTAFNFGTGDFTIEFWLNATVWSGGPGIVGQKGDDNSPGWVIYKNTGSNFMNVRLSGTTDRISTRAPIVGQWQHWALVRSGTTLTWYCDGQSSGVHTGVSTNVLDTAAPLYIGFAQTWSAYFNGYISNLRIVKGAALYTSNFTPSNTPLTTTVSSGTVSLLTLVGNNQISDLSSNALSISMTGSPKLQLQSPFTALPAYSVEFTRSSSQYVTVSNAGGQFAFGTGAFTIECWINLKTMPGGDGYSSGYYILGGGPLNGASGVDYWIGPSTIAVSLASYGTNQASGSHGMSVGNWYHVVLVRGGTNNQTVSIFINGSRVATASGISVTADPMSTGIAISAGEPSGATGANFDAYISNYRIVKGTAVYDPTSTTLTVPTSTLTAVANTSLLVFADQRFPFNDISGNNLLASPINSPTQSILSPFTTTAIVPAAGYYGSVSFNGSTDYYTAPSSVFAFGAANFTVEAWVYLRAMPTSDTWPSNYSGNFVVAECGTPSAADGFVCMLGTTKIYVQSNETVYGTALHGMTTNTWYHVAWVRNGNFIYFYVNGVQVGSVAFSGSVGTGSNTYIGCETGQGAFFNGYISNLRIVRGSAVYTAKFTPSTIPLTDISGAVLLTFSTSTVVGSTTPINQTTNPTFILTPVGSPTFTAFGPFVSYTPLALGAYGGSMYFNGSSYLTIASNTAFNVFGGDMTVECWFYATSLVNSPHLFAFVQDGTNRESIYFNGSALTFWTSSGAGSGGRISTSALSLNTWYHMAVVKSGATFSMYLNGAVVGTSTTTQYSTSNQSLQIGTYNNGVYAGDNFNGYISNVRIVKGTAVYTTNFIPPTQPVTAIANTSLLLNAANTELIDSTGNNDIIPSSPSTSIVSTAQSKFGSKSMYFNGSTFLTVPANQNITFGTGDFTIEMWIYSGANGTGTRLMGNGAGSGWSANKWVIATSTPSNVNKFIFAVNNYTSSGDMLISTTPSNDSAWHHFAVTRSGSTWRIFIDGNLQQTITSSVSVDNSVAANITVGKSGFSGDSNFTGYIDDLRITPGVARYVSSFTPVDTSTNINDIYPSATQLYLRGDAGTLTNTFADSSANNFTVTKTGTPGQGTFSPSAVGYYSTYFNGSTDYLTTSASSNFDFGTGDFTIECWFHIAGNSPTQNNGVREAILFSNDDDITSGAVVSGSINLSITGTASTTGTGILFYRRQTSGPSYAEEFLYTGTIAQNTWHHLAVVKSGSNIKIFLNGTSVLSTTAVNTTFGTSAKVFSIGSRLVANYRSYLKGYISNLRVVKGTAVYTANFTPSTTPLTAVSGTSLLACYDGTMMVNQTPGSTSTTSFTITGSPRTTSWSPFAYNFDPAVMAGSYYFDGSADYLSVADTTALNVAGSNWTVECWINPTGDYSNYRCVWAKRSGGTTSYQGYLAITSGYLAFYNGTQYVSTTTPPANAWSHVAWVFDTSTSKVSIFLNGSIIYTTTAITITNQAVPFNIGYAGNGTEYFQGYISNLRVVKGTAQYSSIYALNAPSTELALVGDSSNAYTTLLLNGNLQNSVLGDTIVDTSPNALTLTKSGTPTISAKSPFTNAGVSGNSIYLNGSTDYLTVPANAAFSFGTGDFTIEAWIYKTATGNLGIWTNGPASAGSFAFYVVSNKLQTDFYGGTSLAGATTLVNNTWYHIATSRSGTNLRIFLNGVIDATATSSSNNTTNNCVIGLPWTNLFTGSFNGYISNLRIVNGTAVYTAAFTPSTTPLTAISGTSFLLSTQTLQNNTFVDSSSNALTIIRNGTPTQGTFSPYYGSYYSTLFSSTNDNLTLTNNAAFTFPADFTIEMWLNPTNPTAKAIQRIFASNSGPGGACYFSVGNDVGTNAGAGRLCAMGHLTSPYTSGLISDTTPLVANTWYHVALVRSGSTITIYKNGISVASGTDSATWDFNNGGGVRIGSSGWSQTNECYLGYISNLRVVKGTAVYTANFTPSTTPLTTTSQGVTAATVSLLTCNSNGFKDSSSNAFSITAAGTPSIQPWQPFNRTSEYSSLTNGGSMYFNGTGDYLSSTTTAFQHTGDFTYECWVYWNGTVPSDWPMIFDTRPSNTAQSTSICCNIHPSSFRLNFYLNGTNYYWGSTALPANVWVHVAVVRSSGTVRIYQNGVLGTDTLSNSNTFSGATGIRIGANIGNMGYWPGYISNFRVTDTAVYTTNFIPSLTPVTAIANTSLLLNGTNAGIVDNSSNNDVKTVGSAQLSTSIKKFGTASIYLGGSGNYVEIASSTNLDFGTGDFTIECWVYSVSIAVNYPTFMSSITGWSAGASGHRFNNTGQANKFSFHLNGAGDPFLASTNTFSFNTWYHYALTRSGNTWRMFINGSLESTGTYSGSYNPALGGMRLGYSTWDGGNGWFNGYLDDLRITKGVARYTSSSRNFIPSTAVLTQTSQGATAATTSLLLTAQNSNLIDSTIKNNFTIVGNVTTSTSTVKVGATSMYFDGSSYAFVNGQPNHFSSGDFTVELWYYATSFPNNMPLVDYNPVGARNAAYFTLWITSSGQPYYYTNGTTQITGTSTLLNTWNHVAVVRLGTSTKMYVNGVVQSTTYTDSNTYLSSAGRPMIGGDSGAPSNNLKFFGYIDDFRVSNVARYTANFYTGPYTASSLSSTVSVAANTSLVYLKVGSTVTFTITTTNLADGTILNWTNTGTSSTSYFADGLNTGSVIVVNNTATVTRTVSTNASASASTLILSISNLSGTILATSASVSLSSDALPTSVSATYLIVAGGGAGGGKNTGGGGGAGGLLTGSFTLATANRYVVVIGAGGASAANALQSYGGSGTSSSIGGIASTVGGGGGGNGVGSGPARAGLAGGSGGGGGGDDGGGPFLGGAGTAGQGYAGGRGTSPGANGGGGGGAGAVGGDSVSNTRAGTGGVGVASSISGTSTYYAGGGGGGGNATAGAGGLGGGGAGTAGNPPGSGTAGTANTGGGGGGAGGWETSNLSGAGGSGIVIVSYSGPQLFAGGTVTSIGGNTIHTFTTSGSLS